MLELTLMWIFVISALLLSPKMYQWMKGMTSSPTKIEVPTTTTPTKQRPQMASKVIRITHQTEQVLNYDDLNVSMYTGFEYIDDLDPENEGYQTYVGDLVDQSMIPWCGD